MIGDRPTESGSGISLDASRIGSAAALDVAGARAGALPFGRLTDRIGRKQLFLVILISTARSPWVFMAMVLAIFCFASAGAAYLTVSEVFPIESRALSIAFFPAVGTGLGGIVGPLLFAN
jgi:MFS family permease